MTPNKTITQHVVAFLFGFSFIYICFVGLPIDFNFDYIQFHIKTLERTSVLELLKVTFLPLTPGWFYPVEENVHLLLPSQTLLFHLFHAWFPYSLTPFNVGAALGYGMLTAAIFGVAFSWTRSYLYAWLAVFLHASFPSVFFNLTSILTFDFRFFVALLSLSSIVLFYWLTSVRSNSGVQFLFKLVGWFFVIWMVTKLKSSEKIMPFVCLSFLVFQLRSIYKRIGVGQTAAIGATILLSMMLVIPTSLFFKFIDQPAQTTGLTDNFLEKSDKDKAVFGLRWKNGLKRIFWVPPEPFPFSNLRTEKMPRSFSSNLGFFVLWLFWLCLLILPLVLSRSKSSELLPSGKNNHQFRSLLWLLLVWFLAIMAGFFSGTPIHDLRFLTYAYTPGVLLLFLMLYYYESLFLKRRTLIFFWRVLLVVFVTYSCVGNFNVYGKTLGHFAGLQDLLVHAEHDVFTSFYGREPQGTELYLRHQELEDRVVLVDWYELPDDWFSSSLTRLNQEGVLFFYAREEESERIQVFRKAGYDVKLWKRYDFLDAKPLIFKILKQISHWKDQIRGFPKRREVLVYQIKHSTSS